MALISGLVFSALLDVSYLEAFAQFPFASPLTMLVAESSFMLFYVWYQPVQRRLGRFFLPVGLAIVILSPIIGSYVEMLHAGDPRLSAYHANWNLFVTLFIPLVILAWQYSFRAVVKFVIFTTAADILLKVSVIGFDLQDYYVIWSVTAIRVIAFLMVGYMITTLIDAQRKMRRELAEANVNLANLSLTSEQLTISRERNRMARELHDTLAHTLSGVAVQLEAVSALWESDNQSARLMLEQSLAATRSGLTETRRALQSLRASPLEDMGVILAIRNMARAVAKRSGLTLDLQLCDQLENLSPKWSNAFIAWLRKQWQILIPTQRFFHMCQN
jgi:signal transduction histidine kinase